MESRSSDEKEKNNSNYQSPEKTKNIEKKLEELYEVIQPLIKNSEEINIEENNFKGYHKEIKPENQSNPISLEQLEIIMEQMKKNLCKIYKQDGSFGSGFFCKIPFKDEFNMLPVLFTTTTY